MEHKARKPLTAPSKAYTATSTSSLVVRTVICRVHQSPHLTQSSGCITGKWFLHQKLNNLISALQQCRPYLRHLASPAPQSLVPTPQPRLQRPTPKARKRKRPPPLLQIPQRVRLDLLRLGLVSPHRVLRVYIS